jgi:hypothetical protein
MRSMVEGACSSEASLLAEAPSTALTRGPPPPRCGGGNTDPFPRRSRARVLLTTTKQCEASRYELFRNLPEEIF